MAPRPCKSPCARCRTLPERLPSPPSAGDVNWIEVGTNTNIQDNAVVHVAKHSIDGKPAPTKIGNNVTIGEPGAQQVLHGNAVDVSCVRWL
eukprot:360633-Chlamydomonas_euryale.AAC.17